jgi:branched-chain amino acid transport system substrate-binding protein
MLASGTRVHQRATMKPFRSALRFAAALVVLGPWTAQAEILVGAAAQLTGDYAWLGEQVQRGAEMAIDDINAAGGVLGEPIRLLVVDDYCRGDQAVAAARKLVDAGVVFVAGHPCSGAAIPASKVYEEAGTLMISSTASNPRLTDEGGPNIFRMGARDDRQGPVVGAYLADHWRDARIAILHDGQPYGKGLAEQVKKQMNQLEVHEAMHQAITPGRVNYFDIIEQMRSTGVNVLFYGGYSTEAALIIRQARDRGYELQLVGVDLYTEQFWLTAGPAGEGALFLGQPEPRDKPEAAEVVRKFRTTNYEPEGGTLYAYAAAQVWAQAVGKAGTLELGAVVEALRGHEFDTVLGRISFDENGDVTGTDTFAWYRWAGGAYIPVVFRPNLRNKPFRDRSRT